MTLFIASTASSFGAEGKTSAKLADAQYDAISRLTRVMALHLWSDRFDQVIGAAPAAKTLGPRWSRDDVHWQKARGEMLKRIDTLYVSYARSEEAKELVRDAFARTLKEDDALKLRGDAAMLSSKQYEAWADMIYAGVEFAMANPKVSPAGSEMKQHTDAVLAELRLDPELANDSTVEKFVARKEATAFGHARDSAVRSLSTGFDGVAQLYFNDALATFRGDVIDAIDACRSGHRK